MRRHIQRCLAAGSCVLVMGSCMIAPMEGPAPPTAARPLPPTGSSPGSPPDATTAALARDVISAGNRARSRTGAMTLASEAGLMQAAQRYADELAIRRELNHQSPTQGLEDVGKRVTAAGVHWSRVGENLAEMSPRIGVAETTIQMWLDSPGHKANLLNTRFTITGVGIARDERGYYYIVQVYATP